MDPGFNLRNKDDMVHFYTDVAFRITDIKNFLWLYFAIERNNLWCRSLSRNMCLFSRSCSKIDPSYIKEDPGLRPIESADLLRCAGSDPSNQWSGGLVDQGNLSIYFLCFFPF